MTWLKIIKQLLRVTLLFTEIARDKRLMAAGEVQANLDTLQKQIESVDAAIEARRTVRAGIEENPETLREDDGFRRD